MAAVVAAGQHMEWQGGVEQKRSTSVFKEVPGAHQKLHNQWNELMYTGGVQHWLFDPSIKDKLTLFFFNQDTWRLVFQPIYY